MNSTVNTPKKAFVLVHAITSSANSKLDKFLALLKTCEIELTIGHQLPELGTGDEYQFIFVDYAIEQKLRYSLAEVAQLTQSSSVVLFNCDQHCYDEKQSLFSGIKGIFYQEDRPDIILKGIQCLTRGESWFKRSTMSAVLSELLSSSKQSIKIPANKNTELADDTDSSFSRLTKREKTIIQLVSDGAQNKEIAARLHISPNTVKTHIYSIFRKTNSRNRIELLTWSQRVSQEWC